MNTSLARPPMPRRKGAAPRTDDVPVKMDGEVVRKAKIVAAYRGLSLAEFLSETLGSIVDRLLDEEHAKERRPSRGEGNPETKATARAPKAKGSKAT